MSTDVYDMFVLFGIKPTRFSLEEIEFNLLPVSETVNSTEVFVECSWRRTSGTSRGYYAF